MKISNRILFGALCLFTAASLYAAPKGDKVIWVSPEANGTLLTSAGKESVEIKLDKAVDFFGYKYVTYECSSPDGGSIDMLYFNTVYGKAETVGGQKKYAKSSTILIRGVSKKTASFQTFAYGATNKYYDFAYDDNGNADVRKADKTLCDRITMDVMGPNWTPLEGKKVYLKKVTATNQPLGKVYSVGLSDQRFAAADEWDDGYYGCGFSITDLMGASPKKGDVLQIKLKGRLAYDIGHFELSITDAKDETGSRFLSQNVHMPAMKAGAIDLIVEFTVNEACSNIKFNLYTKKSETDGAFLFLFD